MGERQASTKVSWRHTSRGSVCLDVGDHSTWEYSTKGHRTDAQDRLDGQAFDISSELRGACVRFLVLMDAPFAWVAAHHILESEAIMRPAR